MRYLSVCSGIEAATVAWHPMGWEPAAFSEIEAFPRAVLEHHYPHVPLHGDFTTIKGDEYGSIDLLVGGTPCQSFSIAGILEIGDLPPQYYLSAKACAGILRRAKKRGKELPEQLAHALASVAEQTCKRRRHRLWL